MTDLAVTARCLTDLEALPPDVAEHILLVFAQRRGLDPNSGETMRRLGGPLRKLHADLSGGRSIRAVTWYDPGLDACWLIAAGWHDDVYRRVGELARSGKHLPSPSDIANFAADAPIRLLERVVRSARWALEQALATPGLDVPLTETPPPKAFFRVEGDKLWVRVVAFEQGRRRLTQREIAAIGVAVFGRDGFTFDSPEHGAEWDSIYLVGARPSIESWPPPPTKRG